MAKTSQKKKSDTSLASRIEVDLLAGKFRPGEWLKQLDIEQSYKANRFDVRMALVDLKSRKLIEHVPNRGFRVLNLTAIERGQLLETRTILESAAARMAATRASSNEIFHLEKLAQRFGNGMETASLDELRVWNAQFHEELYALSGNDVLLAEIIALRQRGIPGSVDDGGVWRSVGGLQQSHDDHMRIIELLRDKDSDGVAKLVDIHVNRTRKLFAS